MNRNSPPSYSQRNESSDRSFPVMRRLLLVAVGVVLVLVLLFRGCGSSKQEVDKPPPTEETKSPVKQNTMEGNQHYEVLIPAQKKPEPENGKGKATGKVTGKETGKETEKGTGSSLP